MFVISQMKYLASLGAKILLCGLLTGCTSYGKISNLHLAESPTNIDYSIRHGVRSRHSQDITLVLAFSGGGSRAAALSLGVLQALRDSQVSLNNKSQRLLDQIDVISAVSGGSFTAAYYGLYGDQVFKNYEKEFLRRNVTGELIGGLFNPALWFSKRGRTEMAINYYERTVFKGATFADMARSNGPMIVINASDMGRGVRFSFLQDYFDLLCSDLSSFPVARAVTASSAVPIMFNPVVLQNHPDCGDQGFRFLERAREQVGGSPQLENVVDGLASYAQKEQRRFIHLVDGGITDNLGLLAIYEVVEVAGGMKRFMQSMGGKPTPKFVVISVNASTSPQYTMEQSNRVPSIEDTISAISDTQLHRANAKTLELFEISMQRWSEELSTPNFSVEPYFVEINFNSIDQVERRLFFNQIPVGLSLQTEQVDALIGAGRELLLSNPEFQRLLQDLR